MKKDNTKILVIGLDGATWKILDPLIKKGKLPFIKKLKNKYSSGILNSTIPSISASAWASFQTGVNPGKHSVYDFFYIKDNAKKIVNSKNIKAEKIWDYLGKEGHKSLLINMPISYPVMPINGVITSSFLTPKNEKYLYPDEYQKIFKKLDYEVDIFLGGQTAFPNEASFSDSKKKKILNNLITIAKKRVKVFKKIANMENFSLYFIYFKGLDVIQHIDYDGKLTTRYLQEIDKLCCEVDDFINKKYNKAVTFVISDHGFHKSPDYEFNSNYWFLQNFSAPEKNTSAKIWKYSSRTNQFLKGFGVSLTKFKFFKKLRLALIKKSDIEKNVLSNKEFRTDVKGIYLGSGYTEDDKEKIVTSAKLLKISNKKVFQTVDLRENLYTGKYLENAPDIVWMTNESFVINPSKVTNRLFVEHKTNLAGEHYSDREGIYLAKGVGINRSRNKSKIEDILPTILYILKIDITNFVDGDIMDIFRKKVEFQKISEYKRLDNLVTKQFINVRNKS